MPRQLRVEFPGAIYHVLSRGDRREDIFLDDVDWQDFPKTLAEASQKTGFEVHAYPWSSLLWYAAAREHRPPWLCVDRLLGEHGIGEDSTGGRAPFEERMEGTLGEHTPGSRNGRRRRCGRSGSSRRTCGGAGGPTPISGRGARGTQPRLRWRRVSGRRRRRR